MHGAIEAFTSHGSWLSEGHAHILLAEDDPEFRALLALVLAGDGYEVDEVADGTAFKAWVDCRSDVAELAQDCQLIITDVRMPGCSGLDVVSTLRGKGSGIPVIVLTALRDESTQRRVVSLGAAALFNKPFDLDDLRMAVLNTLCHTPAGGEPLVRIH